MIGWLMTEKKEGRRITVSCTLPVYIISSLFTVGMANPVVWNSPYYGIDPGSPTACMTIIAMVTITIAAIQMPGWLIADSDRLLVMKG